MAIKHLAVGDPVIFKKPQKWIDGRIFVGPYRIQGFIADAMGKMSVCLNDIPGCYPITRFAKMELVDEYRFPSYQWACRLGRSQALSGRLIDYRRGKFICHKGGETI